MFCYLGGLISKYEHLLPLHALLLLWLVIEFLTFRFNISGIEKVSAFDVILFHEKGKAKDVLFETVSQVIFRLILKISILKFLTVDEIGEVDKYRPICEVLKMKRFGEKTFLKLSQ